MPAAGEWLSAIRARAALVAEAQPSGIHGPPLRHLLGELQFLTRPLKRKVAGPVIRQSANPRVVMLLPGFATHPIRLRRLAQHLEKAGHTVKNWGLGFNMGPTPENFDLVTERVLDLQSRYGEQVVLVGWSLGGVFAREVAKRNPDAIAKVVTMGSPVSGNPKVEAPPVVADISAKPPVPTVALWSPCDGIVSPRSSCGRPGERDRAVALRCGHMGFAYSDEAIEAVLRELENI